MEKKNYKKDDMERTTRKYDIELQKRSYEGN